MTGNIPAGSAPEARILEPRAPVASQVGSLLLWLWIALSGSVLSVVGLLLFLPFNPWIDPQRRMMERINRLWARGLLAAGIGLRVDWEGKEKLFELPGPFVICANHQSIVDVAVLLAVVPRVKCIAKRALFRLPLMGLQFRLSGYIVAGASEIGDADRVLASSESWLRRGSNILVFPEGTRSVDGSVRRLGQGPFLLARRAQVSVLPIAISGTREVHGKGRFAFHLNHRVRVAVLEPVRVEGDPKRVASQVRASIQQAIERQSAPSSAEWPTSGRASFK